MIMELTSVNPDTSIADMDSLGRVELVMYAEETLSLALTDKEIKDCKTFGDLEKLVESKGIALKC